MNPQNKIRPVKIKIIHPSPKKNTINYTELEEKKYKKSPLNLLFFLLIGFFIFAMTHLLSRTRFSANLAAWKSFSIDLLLFYVLALLLPFSFYLLYQKKDLRPVSFVFQPLTAILSFLLGFPFAFLSGFLNYILSFLGKKIGLLNYTFSTNTFANFYNLSYPLHMLIFLLIICLLPALLFEIIFRDFFLSESIRKMKQGTAVFLSSLLTACFMLKSEMFLPYFLLGFLCSLIFLSHLSIINTILCHFSFALTYHILMNRVSWLQINYIEYSGSGLKALYPIILKGLLAASLCVPLIVILNQTQKINPLMNSREMIARHAKKKNSGQSFDYFLMCLILIIFILLQIF